MHEIETYILTKTMRIATAKLLSLSKTQGLHKPPIAWDNLQTHETKTCCVCLWFSCRTRLAYRICKVQTAASAVGCGWMWSEKLNNRKSDGGMTGGPFLYYIFHQLFFHVFPSIEERRKTQHQLKIMCGEISWVFLSTVRVTFAFRRTRLND